MIARDEVRKHYERAQEMLSLARQALEMVQQLCTHPAAEKKARANTVNYDPSADCYWKEYKCYDCGKRWEEDQ